jgi:hypothetical protein
MRRAIRPSGSCHRAHAPRYRPSYGSWRSRQFGTWAQGAEDVAHHQDHQEARCPGRAGAEHSAVIEADVGAGRRAIKAGQLKIYRAGRQIMIDESDLVDYISLQKLKW